MIGILFFFFSSRRRHTRSYGDWSSDVCSSDLVNFPKQLDWTTSAWGTPETELDSAGAAVENVRVVWDTSGDSTLFWIVLNTGTNIHAYKCTNTDACVKEDVDPSSGNDYAVTQAVGIAPERHCDVST